MFSPLRHCSCLRLLQGFPQLVERLLQDGAWRGHVQSHESLAALAEHFAIVEGEVCPVYEEVDELVVGEPQLSAVEPHEERGLWPQGFYLRHVLTAVVLHKQDVLLHVMEHGPAPRFALLEGGYGGYGCEERGLVELVGGHPRVEFLSQRVVGHDGVGAHDARNVECF